LGARQLRHQNRIDLASLRQHLAPLGAVELHARGCFLVGADDVVPRPLGEGGEIPFLAAAGLIGGRDPAVERRALSQLNPPRRAARKPLFPHGSEP